VGFGAGVVDVVDVGFGLGADEEVDGLGLGTDEEVDGLGLGGLDDVDVVADGFGVAAGFFFVVPDVDGPGFGFGHAQETTLTADIGTRTSPLSVRTRTAGPAAAARPSAPAARAESIAASALASSRTHLSPRPRVREVPSSARSSASSCSVADPDGVVPPETAAYASSGSARPVRAKAAPDAATAPAVRLPTATSIRRPRVRSLRGAASTTGSSPNRTPVNGSAPGTLNGAVSGSAARLPDGHAAVGGCPGPEESSSRRSGNWSKNEPVMTATLAAAT